MPRQQREERLLVDDLDAELARLVELGTRFPAGNFVMDDNEALAGDRVLVNTSFSHRIRVYDIRGDSVRTFGQPPPSWVEPTPPGPGETEGGSTEEQMRRWLTSFTIVTMRSGTSGCVFLMASMNWFETSVAICTPNAPAPVARVPPLREYSA